MGFTKSDSWRMGYPCVAGGDDGADVEAERRGSQPSMVDYAIVLNVVSDGANGVGAVV